jgi:NTE family protein
MALDYDRPVSLVLGGGGVRGMAHIGVLDALAARGVHVDEIVGTSVGALVAAFYAAVGMEVDELRAVGLGMTSRHLLAWSWLRRAPEPVRRRFLHRAGQIPSSLERLALARWDRLHHGVERIGFVSYDPARRREVVGHSGQTELGVADAARGAAAIPGFFPAIPCVVDGRPTRLVDGGVVNILPVDVLFRPPFAPSQILAVDISKSEADRARAATRVEALGRAHPDVPIVLVSPETIGAGTILYRGRALEALAEAGRRAVVGALEARPG